MEIDRRTIGIALMLAASASCRFDLPRAGSDDTGIPDAGVCLATSPMCTTDTVLRECRTVGELAVDTVCSWGCIEAGAAPHCGQLQPTGTVVTAADLMPNPALLDISRALAAGTIGVINADDGSITTVRTAGTGIRSSIDFQIRTFDAGAAGTRRVGMFRFGKLALTGNWIVRGSNALAIVSLGDVVLQGRFDLKGDCANRANPNAGPGGFPGGFANTNAAGPGGGKGGAPSGSESSGGGGGGHGASGGAGGRAPSSPGRPAGGTSIGDEQITLLRGGGGGGGGGNGGAGGGGGGAIHIVANGKVALRTETGLSPSGINAGGCGGQRALVNSGGGGGAGGAILIEATELELDGAHLAVNGGGGGGASADGLGGLADGADGEFGIARAKGGIGGRNGGDGGAASSRTGAMGADGNDGGGGGGGVGRIRINTRTSTGVTVKSGALVSPTFEEPNSTSTKAAATIQ